MCILFPVSCNEASNLVFGITIDRLIQFNELLTVSQSFEIFISIVSKRSTNFAFSITTHRGQARFNLNFNIEIKVKTDLANVLPHT